MPRRGLNVGSIGPSSQSVSRRACFKVTAVPGSNAQVLVVDGDVTLETANSFELMASQLTRPVVVVDFSRSTMISSAALSVLVKLLCKWRGQAQDPRIVADDGPVSQMLHSEKILKLASVYSSRRQALQGITGYVSEADVLVVEAKEAVTALEGQNLEVLSGSASNLDHLRGRAPVLLLELSTLESLGSAKSMLKKLSSDWHVVLVGPNDRDDIAKLCGNLKSADYIPEPVIVNELAEHIRKAAGCSNLN